MKGLRLENHASRGSPGLASGNPTASWENLQQEHYWLDSASSQACCTWCLPQARRVIQPHQNTSCRMAGYSELIQYCFGSICVWQRRMEKPLPSQSTDITGASSRALEKKTKNNQRIFLKLKWWEHVCCSKDVISAYVYTIQHWLSRRLGYQRRKDFGKS